MSLHFATASGSHYEIKRHHSLEGDGDHLDYVRRVNLEAGKRADGDWVRLYRHFPNPIQEGSGVLLEMESLHEYGPDDDGAPSPDPCVTIRTTTAVTRIWTEGEAA